MIDKKIKKISVDLNPIQMVWLHSQHLFQKLEQNTHNETNQIKFFKNNNGVEIKLQHYNNQSSDYELLVKAKKQLIHIINQNQIRLIQTSLHKDLYIRISKEARKQFPKSYIIFLHYQTFENCCRKLQQKFNITSIAPQLQKLRKSNPNFCFLIAQKTKIDDIQKFTTRILNSQVSCASTTFSQPNYRRQPSVAPACKKAMSVSSLRGSFSDQNQQQYRYSLNNANIVEQQMFQMSQSIISKIPQKQLQKIIRTRQYEGCHVYIQKFEGNYLNMTKKLYYANRLQLTSNPYMQTIYAYSMLQKSFYNKWSLCMVTDKKYKKLSEIWGDSFKVINISTKIDILIKVAKALIVLHKNNQTYSDLSLSTILLDENKNIFLSAIIDKKVPPHTNPYLYDVRKYLLLVFQMFTDVQISYELLLKKYQKEDYFCSLSYRCKNQLVKKFMDIADKLFIGDVSFQGYIQDVQLLIKN